MNKVILMGRTTKDVTVNYTQGENPIAIARWILAVPKRGNRDDEPDFIPCVAFGSHATFAEKYFHQGIKLVITGRLQTGNYTNKHGEKVWTYEVVVEDQEFAESKKNAPQQGAPQQNAPQQNAPQQNAPQQGAYQQGAPQQNAPQQGTYQQGAPQQNAPQQGAYQQNAPQQGTPQQNTSSYVPQGEINPENLGFY